MSVPVRWLVSIFDFICSHSILLLGCFFQRVLYTRWARAMEGVLPPAGKAPRNHMNKDRQVVASLPLRAKQPWEKTVSQAATPAKKYSSGNITGVPTNHHMNRQMGFSGTSRVRVSTRHGSLFYGTLSRVAGISSVLSIPLRARSHTRRTAVVEGLRPVEYG